MGYKSTFRSFNAAMNRSARASQVRANQKRRELQKQQKQLQATYERAQRKSTAAEAKRSKPLQALNELYAAGKIDKKQFESLSKRDSEITIDLIIFGRGAGSKLSERYVTGKISSEEFESLKNEILGEPEAEKDRIIDDFKSRLKLADDFVEKARSNKKDSECNYCGKSKKLFSPLFKENDFKLCMGCRSEFNKLKSYPGHIGQYYEVSPAVFNIDGKTDLIMNIKSGYLLNYS